MKSKDIENFRTKTPTFMWTQVRIWKDLCSQTEHIPTFLMNFNNSANKVHQTGYNILCWAVFPVQLYFSSTSRGIWMIVAKNYIGFCFMSVGFWTEVMVQELSIIDNFEIFRNFAKGNTRGGGSVSETSHLSVHFNPLRMKDDATNVYLGANTDPDDNGEEEDIDSAEDIERRGFFVKYLSAVTSCRSVLWQLIPGMTAVAILSVDLSTCPVFIFSSSIEDNHLLPPLLVRNSWTIAENQIKDGLGGKPNKKPYYWQLALLSFYIFINESRLIQFVVVVINNSTAFAIVFSSSNLVACVILFLATNLLVGFAQFGYTVLLLHQFFQFSRGTDENDTDTSISVE